MSDPDRIARYVDGELDAVAASALEAEMAADPALAAEVARQERLRARLATAYEPVIREPVPERLLAAVATKPRPVMGLPTWTALAAGIALGAMLGLWSPGRAPTDGGLGLTGEVARALDRQLASENAGKAIQVGMSFRAGDGRYCRTFQDAKDAVAGLACGRGGRWRAEVASAYRPGAATEYRTAAAATPPAVLAAVDAMIAGEALDGAGERAARDRGWKD